MWRISFFVISVVGGFGGSSLGVRCDRIVRSS